MDGFARAAPRVVWLAQASLGLALLLGAIGLLANAATAWHVAEAFREMREPRPSAETYFALQTALSAISLPLLLLGLAGLATAAATGWRSAEGQRAARAFGAAALVVLTLLPLALFLRARVATFSGHIDSVMFLALAAGVGALVARRRAALLLAALATALLLARAWVAATMRPHFMAEVDVLPPWATLALLAAPAFGLLAAALALGQGKWPAREPHAPAEGSQVPAGPW